MDPERVDGSDPDAAARRPARGTSSRRARGCARWAQCARAPRRAVRWSSRPTSTSSALSRQPPPGRARPGCASPGPRRYRRRAPTARTRAWSGRRRSPSASRGVFAAVAERGEHLGDGVVRDQERGHRRRTGRDLLDDDELVADVAPPPSSAGAPARHPERPRSAEGDEQLLVETARPSSSAVTLVRRRDLGHEPPHRGAQLGPLPGVGDGSTSRRRRCSVTSVPRSPAGPVRGSNA